MYNFFIGIRTKINDVSLEQFVFTFPVYLVAATTCRYIIGDRKLEDKEKLAMTEIYFR